MMITKIHLYNLGNTHATILLNNSKNIKVISESLGHRSIKTTMDIYTQIITLANQRQRIS